LGLWYATELLIYHLSDHLPLWVALAVDFATDYVDDTISQASGG
jgi:hypothetical protein